MLQEEKKGPQGSAEPRLDGVTGEASSSSAAFQPLPAALSSSPKKRPLEEDEAAEEDSIALPMSKRPRLEDYDVPASPSRRSGSAPNSAPSSPPRTPTRDAAATTGPAISPHSGKKSILSTGKKVGKKKRVSFAEEPKLVQERSTVRWVTVSASLFT